MNVKDALFEAQEILSDRATSRLDSELVLCHVLSFSREQLFCSPNLALDEANRVAFFKLISEVATGKPVSYITHTKEFFGRTFYVDERVLIPRPETELLIEKGIELAHGLYIPNPRLLDLGCGSGCIGLTLASELPSARVTLADISIDALDVTRINAENLHLTDKVRIWASDLLSNLFDRQFDIIVANLPYIGTEKHDFVEKNVKGFEPHSALFSGADGLDLYKKLFQEIALLKTLPKYVLGEFGDTQSEDLLSAVSTIFVQQKHTFEIFPDLAGKDRVFLISFS